MWSAIVQTVLRDRISVIFTTDSINTAALLVFYLCKQVHTDGFRKSESASSLPGVAPYKRKRENLNDTAPPTRAMLCILPGMSAAKSNCVLQVYPTARGPNGSAGGRLGVCGLRCTAPGAPTRSCTGKGVFVIATGTPRRRNETW